MRKQAQRLAAPTVCPNCDFTIWGTNKQYQEIYKIIRTNHNLGQSTRTKEIEQKTGLGSGCYPKIIARLIELRLIYRVKRGYYAPLFGSA